MSYSVDNAQSYVPGIVSERDWPLYDGQTIGTSGVTLNIFSDTLASAGEDRTNLTQPNMLPSNWKQFRVMRIGIKMTDTVPLSAADTLSFLTDSWYQYTRATTIIRKGSMREFLGSSGLFTIAPTVSSNTTYASADVQHTLLPSVPLTPNDVIATGESFNFQVTYTGSGITSFLTTKLFVFFYGILTLKVAG